MQSEHQATEEKAREQQQLWSQSGLLKESRAVGTNEALIAVQTQQERTSGAWPQGLDLHQLWDLASHLQEIQAGAPDLLQKDSQQNPDSCKVQIKTSAFYNRRPVRN